SCTSSSHKLLSSHPDSELYTSVQFQKRSGTTPHYLQILSLPTSPDPIENQTQPPILTKLHKSVSTAQPSVSFVIHVSEECLLWKYILRHSVRLSRDGGVGGGGGGDGEGCNGVGSGGIVDM